MKPKKEIRVCLGTTVGSKIAMRITMPDGTQREIAVQGEDLLAAIKVDNIGYKILDIHATRMMNKSVKDADVWANVIGFIGSLKPVKEGK